MNDKKDFYRLARIKEICENNYFPVYSDFNDEGFQEKIQDIMKRYDVPYLFFGGNAQSQRRILCIYPDYISKDDLIWPICSLIFKKTSPINHRHVLGTLMSLGITRELIGDIDVGQEWVQVIIHERIKDYLLIHFNEINHCKIQCLVKEIDEMLVFERQYKRITFIISSNRIDGLLGKIWKHSRQNSLDLIKQKKVKINDAEITKKDYQIKNNDIIALKGKGKARVVSLDKKKKKGNIRVLLDLYQ